MRDEWAIKNRYISPGMSATIISENVLKPLKMTVKEALCLCVYRSSQLIVYLYKCAFCYVSGPIQFMGPGANDVNHTLLLELGAVQA